MNTLPKEMLPFLIPVLVIELVLAFLALIHVLRHCHYRFGTKAMWVVIVLFLLPVGPIVYFILGRGENQ